MSDLKRQQIRTLDGEWIAAAPKTLLEAVERNDRPATPRPGSAPPAGLPDGPPLMYRVRTVVVPTCWEAGAFPKPYEGPVWFSRRFGTDDSFRHPHRVRLEFDAVSYFATVWLNGRRLGEHRGMWDPFSFDVTGLLREDNVVSVEVYKPWELFPVRESLAGFIPYVTTSFGGIWQSVRLRRLEEIEVTDLFADPRADDDGRRVLRVSGTVHRAAQPERLDGHAAVSAGIRVDVRAVAANPEGAVGDAGSRRRVASVLVRPDSHTRTAPFTIDLDAGGLPDWSPSDPQLVAVDVTARVTAETPAGDASAADHRVADDRAPTVGSIPHGAAAACSYRLFTGMRRIGIDGRLITLNDAPIYPRGVLHWLSYPESIAPAPSRETIRREIEGMQALGFTMMKLCLVVPPEAYFELADELGMMIWLELPMWLPEVNDAFRARAREEYRRILRRVRNHPSVVMYTLGCELSSEADASFLRELYDLVKDETGATLVRDNSGSAEAYGGVDLEFADYHDYHFYAEATVFTDLLDYFVPAWKPDRPLVFGEYCDSDTFRSVAEVKRVSGRDLYWSKDDPVENPKGVRWDYNVVTNEERLATLDIEIPFDEIRRRSYAKSLGYRKSIIEQTRLHPAASGYVVTNIQDTPITTSGMLDDFGRLKFDAAAFRQFNAETVIVAERDRRRIWRRGGDRPQHLDPRVFASGEKLRQNLLVAHGGLPIRGARLRWELVGSPAGLATGGSAGIPVGHGTPDDHTAAPEILARGTIDAGEIRAGKPAFVGTAECPLPSVDFPRRLHMRTALIWREAEAAAASPIAENAVEIWVLPNIPIPWDRVDVVDDRGLFGPEMSRAKTEPVAIGDVEPRSGRPLVATRWDERLPELAAAGLPLIVLLDDTTSGLTEECPFFREAIPLVHDHAIVSDLPHNGYAGTLWSGVTPERAIAVETLGNAFRGVPEPVVSRLDARTSLLSHYMSACEVPVTGSVVVRGARKSNRIVATTFALTGGVGRTPQGLRHNILGRYLLTRMIDYVDASMEQ